MSEQFEKDVKMLEKLKPFLEENGYKHLRVVEGRGICGLEPFLYTVGLCYGLDEIGRRGRYCYPHKDALQAVVALAVWDGKEDPIGKWIKHKGYDGDYWNPLVPEEK